MVFSARHRGISVIAARHGNFHIDPWVSRLEYPMELRSLSIKYDAISVSCSAITVMRNEALKEIQMIITYFRKRDNHDDSMARVIVSKLFAGVETTQMSDVFVHRATPLMYRQDCTEQTLGDELYRIGEWLYDCAVIPTCDSIADYGDIPLLDEWESFTPDAAVALCMGIEIARYAGLRD
jgi:hypothetical protein